MDSDVEDFLSAIKLQRLHPPGSRRYRHVEDYLRHEFSTRQDAMNEAMRLLHLADNGDEGARTQIAPIAPAWEFGAEELADGDTCPCCLRVIGKAASAIKGKGKADDVEDEADAPYAPSAKPGSITDLAWRSLVALSPAGEPVDAKEWRDAALIALARSERVSDPVTAFRDAKRNLKGQRAFEEDKDDAIRRRT